MHYKCLCVLSVFVAVSALCAPQPAWAQRQNVQASVEDCFAQCQSSALLDEQCLAEDIEQRQEQIEQVCIAFPEGSQERRDCFTEVFQSGPECGTRDFLSCLQGCLENGRLSVNRQRSLLRLLRPSPFVFAGPARR